MVISSTNKQLAWVSYRRVLRLLINPKLPEANDSHVRDALNWKK